MVHRTVVVNDRMQQGYRYELTARAGRDFDPEFTPELTPAEMLKLGVFGGKYMTDCRDEFPAAWFKGAKLAKGRADKALNFFGVDASQPLSEWRRKGWIHPDDPRGWFQWYCRYFHGPADAGGGCAADQALEGDPPARRADQEELRAGRHPLPPPPAPGAAPLGIRQPEDLTRQGGDVFGRPPAGYSAG